MAQKRMFSKSIIESDLFLDMSLSTQALYYHLGMQADDDGFVSPGRVMRMIGALPDDLKILIAKQFVIPFENGVVVIRHWRENNYIQKDRKKDTIYLNELSKLSKEKNNVYKLDTECIQDVHLDKISVDKISVDKIKLQNKILHKQIAEIINEFKIINPLINFGHKTHRTSCEEMIKEFNYEETLKLTKLAISVQGQKFAPTITTPTQLKNKIGDFGIFIKKILNHE